MPTAQETAYPLLKKRSSSQELSTLFSPSSEETILAQRQTRQKETQLAFLIQLKTFQRLGYAAKINDVPEQIKEHIAYVSELSTQLPKLGDYDQSKTQQRHLSVIRDYLQIQPLDETAIQMMQQTLMEVAQAQHDLVDLINVAVEFLAQKRYELPAFSRLLKIARQVRRVTTEQLYQGVMSQIDTSLRIQLDQLFLLEGKRQTSRWNDLKQDPGKPVLSRFKLWLERLAWLQSLQVKSEILNLIPLAKMKQFAAEAMTLDGARMREMQPQKRYTLAVSLVSLQYAHTLDDIAEFLIKRIRKLHHQGKNALEEYRKQTQQKTDVLIQTLHDLMLAFQLPQEASVRLKEMEQVVGDNSQQIIDDCHAHLAYSGNNYFPFLLKFYRSHRPVLFKMLEVLPIISSTQDEHLERAIKFIQDHRWTRKQWVSLSEAAQSEDEDPLDLSWLPLKWRQLITGTPSRQASPTQIHRIYFEICVFSHLSLGLQAGDLHIPGSEQYDDYYRQLISWTEYDEKVEEFGKLLAFPVQGKQFVAHLKQQLRSKAKEVDQAFPANPYITYEGERFILHKKKRKSPEKLKELESQIKERIRPITILDLLDNTQKWIDWTRFFRPISGHDAKVVNPIPSYLMTTFCYGCNIGPTQLAQSIHEMDRRQLSWLHQRHIQEHTLQKAIEETINFYNRFTLPQFWGTGQHASVDGTKWNIFEQNLLAEYHIRYGGYGGIGYYHVADTYIALFSHFIPCGVWEALFIFDGLFNNKSEIQPDTIHGDTQSQSATVFALAFLLGIKLMPRIRGWQKLTFYRPDRNNPFTHLKSLFSEVVPWDLIETHLPDMLRVALSIQAGKIQASTILRKLGTNSPDNKLFKAFQALGGVVRTLYLLDYLHDVDLRNMVQACTNKSESFNRLIKWLAFGGEQQVWASNSCDELLKRIKYNHLVANCVILYNVSEISRILNDLAVEGYRYPEATVARLSPYPTEHLIRFGAFGIDHNREPVPIELDFDLSILEDPETSQEKELQDFAPEI